MYELIIFSFFKQNPFSSIWIREQSHVLPPVSHLLPACHHPTQPKSGASSGRIAHHTATCSWTVCLTERSLLKMKETLASIPPVKRLNTAPFLSYQHFMTVTQGSSVHQAFRPARSRKTRAAAGRSVDDKSTLPQESAATFAIMGLKSTNNDWTVRHST